MDAEAEAHRFTLPDGRTVTVHYGDPETCPDCDREAIALETPAPRPSAEQAETFGQAVAEAAALRARNEAVAEAVRPCGHSATYSGSDCTYAVPEAEAVYPCRTYPGAYYAFPDCRGASHSPDDDVDDDIGCNLCRWSHGCDGSCG